MAHPSRTPVRRLTPSNSLAASPSPPKSRATPTSSIISKGATARSAVPSRASPPASGVRATSGAGISPRSSPVPNGDAHANGREALVASLKRETDEKEELLVRLQEKDAQIAVLTSEGTNITSSLNAAESRLAELYADQSRMEDDMAARMEITEKLRAQVRDLEREKRETLRRYTEQTATFEAERQAFYDNEQHLKSRIQSVMAAMKAQQEAAERPSSPVLSIAEHNEALSSSPKTPTGYLPSKEDDGDVSDGPEVTALKLELSTLSTSHTSLQTMVQMLQTELADLKRVNNELQEENESYGLLLMERAMNGTGLNMLKQMGGDERSVREETTSLEDEKSFVEEGERSSLRSVGRSTLGRVLETEEPALDAEERQRSQSASLASELQDSDADMPHSSRRRRTRQNSVSPSPHGTSRGESLADLPITGPGLDLAAELGRAETKDIFDGSDPSTPGSMDQLSPGKGRRFSHKVPGGEIGSSVKSGELEVLRQEVKSLKDANKALSLYASKIIDRIIMQEGFEHVLAVDYNADDRIPAKSNSSGAFEDVLTKAKESSPTKPKPRPQSMLLGRAASLKIGGPLSSKEGLFKFPGSTEPEKPTAANAPASPAPDVKRNRRSMSFDWKSFSMFGGGPAAPSDKERNLRPLTLRPGGGSALTGARKLETQEDDDDKKERERLNATMKLMGIEKPADSIPAPMAKAQSEPAASEAANTKLASSSRFSFFRSKSTTAASARPSPAVSASPVPVNLTSEALEQAEAETTLASLDAHEKVLTAEIAKGGSGGFTELRMEGRLSLGDEWRSRRSRSMSGKSHESSGASTVWSAGMKGEDEEGERSGS